MSAIAQQINLDDPAYRDAVMAYADRWTAAVKRESNRRSGRRTSFMT